MEDFGQVSNDGPVKGPGRQKLAGNGHLEVKFLFADDPTGTARIV